MKINSGLNSQELAQVGVLLQEVETIKGLIEGATDMRVVEELKEEQAALILKVNQVLGTDYIAVGSRISGVNGEYPAGL